MEEKILWALSELGITDVSVDRVLSDFREGNVLNIRVASDTPYEVQLEEAYRNIILWSMYGYKDVKKTIEIEASLTKVDSKKKLEVELHKPYEEILAEVQSCRELSWVTKPSQVYKFWGLHKNLKKQNTAWDISGVALSYTFNSDFSKYTYDYSFDIQIKDGEPYSISTKAPVDGWEMDDDEIEYMHYLTPVEIGRYKEYCRVLNERGSYFDSGSIKQLSIYLRDFLKNNYKRVVMPLHKITYHEFVLYMMKQEKYKAINPEEWSYDKSDFVSELEEYVNSL